MATISISPPPKGAQKSPPLPPPPTASASSIKPLQTVHEEDPDRLPWPAARDSSSLRNRRRSRGHPVAIVTPAHIGSISETLSGTSASSLHIPTSSTSTSSTSSSGLAPPSDADLTLPLLSPTAPSFAAQLSPDRPYYRDGPKSLSGIAVRAFCLGIALAVGIISAITVLALTRSPLWRLPFYLAALSTFHFLEFWTTAAYNTRAAEVGSFLLTANWPAYAIAHAAAALECLITGLLFPHGAWTLLLPFSLPGACALTTLVGLVVVLVGQVVRSSAMVQAGPSFNHQVQQYRAREHVLVTTGIYAHLRHPSYFGFFWWALGVQLVLGNVVCFVLYSLVLWRFFSGRIATEEEYLVRFFGEEYIGYKKKVGTKIPFIR